MPHLSALRADITTLDVDAIVNAASPALHRGEPRADSSCRIHPVTD